MTALCDWGGELEVALALARAFPGGEWDVSEWDASEWEQTDTALGDWLDVTCETIDGIQLHAGSSATEGVVTRWEAATVSLSLLGERFDPRVGPWAGLLAPGLPVRIRWREIGVATAEWRIVFLGTVADGGYSWDPTTLIASLDCDDRTADLVAFEQLAYTEPMGDGDTAAGRIGRLADLTRLGAAERDITAGGTLLQASDLAGPVWEQMLDVADTDLGLLWVRRDGLLAYRPEGRVREVVDTEAELDACPKQEVAYGPNLLTPDQASFEASIAGWASTTSPPPPVNALGEKRSLFTGVDVVAGVPTGNRNVLGYWWAHTSNAQLARTSDDTGGRPGKAMKLTTIANTIVNIAPSAAGTGAVAQWGTAPGDVRTIFLSIKASRALTVTPTVQFFRADATQISGNVTTSWAIPANAWGDYRFVVTAPAETVYMQWSINFPSLAAGTDTVWFAQAGFFSGNVPAWVPATAATWTRNLLDAERSSVETNNLGQGSVVSGWRASLGGTSSVTRDNTLARDGAWSLRTGIGNAVSARVDSNTTTGSRYGMTVVAQTPYTFMFSVRSPVVVPPNTLLGQIVFFSDAAMTTTAGTVNVVTPAGESMPADTWWDVALYLRATNAAAIRAMLVLSVAGIPADTFVNYDRVGWFAGSVGTWTHPDTPQPGWATAAQASDPLASDGTHVLVLTRNATAGPIEAVTTTSIAATPGTTYEVAADLARGTAGTGGVELEFLDAAGAPAGAVAGTVDLVPMTPMLRATVSGVAPPGTVTLRLRVTADNVPVNGWLKVDRVTARTVTVLPAAIQYVNLLHADPTVLRNWVTIGRGKPFVAEGTPDPPEPPVAVRIDDPSVARFRAYTYKRTDLLHRDDEWSGTLADAVIADGAWPTTAPTEVTLDTRVTADVRVAGVLLGVEPEDVFTVCDPIVPATEWRTVATGWDVNLSRAVVAGSIFLFDVSGWGNPGEWDDPDPDTGWDVSTWALTGVNQPATTKGPRWP